jgi:glutamyl/glutaminyl-tRNA synthetase
VDDHLMGVTHVVRGNEYLSSTPKYNLLYKAFGWEVPTYIHCPLITNEEGAKLSKRSGHSSFEDLIDQGFVTEAIVNFVALLGWSPEGESELFSLKELIDAFDYRRINKSPAVFDMQKLHWMNGEYIKKMEQEPYYERALPYVDEVIRGAYDEKKIADMVKTRISVFPDITEQIGFFREMPQYDVSMYTHKKSKSTLETSAKVLKETIPLLEELPEFDNDTMFEALKAYASEQEMKVNTVMWPLRTAVSGKAATPSGATGIMDVLGREESIRRLKDGLAKVEAALS